MTKAKKAQVAHKHREEQEEITFCSVNYKFSIYGNPNPMNKFAEKKLDIYIADLLQVAFSLAMMVFKIKSLTRKRRNQVKS